jgi:acetylornithine deacetylase/succinyl-diaminopimelate desuccinylase-like protein
MKKKCFTLIIITFLIVIPIICYGEENITIYEEGVRILQDYLRIDTTNPPGNEIKTALFLKKILDKEGIENQIFDIGNNRANLYAILKGDGTKKPVILLHHMDVVPADEKYWTVSPFSGKIIDGYIYGRGAIDIKGKGIVDLMTMIRIKREKIPLKRDIIYLAVSDEEENSLGSKWMVENKKCLIKDADFLIDEGANICEDKKNNRDYYTVSIGEKSPLWLKLIFRGTPGHGSVPIKDSSVEKAIKGGNKIINYYYNNMEFIVLPELIEEIKMIAGEDNMKKLPGYKGDSSFKDQAFLKIISQDPDIEASIKNTISITCLEGSNKINTIPNEATIGLDCRLLPGVNKDEFIENLKKIINDDTMEIKIEEFYNATSSPVNNDFIKAIEICAKKRNTNNKVITTLLLCSTDSSIYRSAGIKSYGFEPFHYSEEELAGSHGNDERISIENVKFGIDLLTDILIEVNKQEKK